MPMEAAIFKPGVDTQQTPTLNSAGIYQSQLIRYKDSLIQTYGGWQQFVGTAIPSTIRVLHAWSDLSHDDWLAVGATNNLITITSGTIYDVTPQTRTNNFSPNFSISTANQFTVTVVDANSGATIYNTA